jgi:hypothetical protein
MIRAIVPLGLLLCSGCLATKVVTVPVKAAGKAAGTIVETGWDAATTTRQEADEDRGRALREAEEVAEREQRRERAAEEKAEREARREAREREPD